MHPTIVHEREPRTRRRRRLGSGMAAATLTVAALLGVGSTSPAAAYDVGVFIVSTHVQDIGWSGSAGSVNSSLRLEAIRVYQKSDRQFCARVHVATLGWQPSACTSSTRRTVTWGTEGRGLAIEAIELWTPGYNFGVKAHIQNLGWVEKQTAYAGQHVTIGTTGQGLRMEAFSFGPYNW